MEITRSTVIAAPPAAVWEVVTDIEGSASTIRGISRIEVLEPATGPSILGLRWRETRTWRGREAVEVMWITEAAPPSHYATRAESHGSIYTARITLTPEAGGTRLAMAFAAEPVTVVARVVWALTGWMAKRALGKTIDADLADLKAAVEGSAPR